MYSVGVFVSSRGVLQQRFHCVIIYLESKNGGYYTYTTGIDAQDTFLFCNSEDSSVQLYNIFWRRRDGISYHSNPLDVFRLWNTLIYSNIQEMECFDTESGNKIMGVQLYIQGLITSTIHNNILNNFEMILIV